MRLRTRARRFLTAALAMTTATAISTSLEAGEQESVKEAKKEHVWFGTYTRGASDGIYVAEFDAKSGELSAARLAARAENPSFLALHPNGKWLYAACENGNFEGKRSGSVAAFAIDAKSGSLELLGEAASGGVAPCHLVVDRTGKGILVANYGGGNVSTLRIADDGDVEGPLQTVQHEGSSVNSRRQEGPHAHSIHVDESNFFAFAVDLGLDKILCYHYDSSSGKLTPNDPPFAKVPPGSGPRHLAFHPTRRFVYVNGELDSTVHAFAYDRKAGRLTFIETESMLPGGEPVPGNSTAEVEAHPNGRFVYVSNRGHDSIAVFAVDQASGKLEQVEVEPTGGKTPRNFGIHPDGEFLLAANQSTNDIRILKIDAKTGELEPSGERIEVPSPVCVLFATRRD